MDNRKQITIDDVKFYNVKTMVEDNGNLTAIESDIDIPFTIKRVFYVFGVEDQSIRGCHAHYETQQLLICLKGKIEVICKDGTSQRKFLLDSPQQGLYVPNMIWDEQIYKSQETILMSICSRHYDPIDYIHDYEQFQAEKGSV